MNDNNVVDIGNRQSAGSDTIADQARAWVIRLDSDMETLSTLRAFKQWLNLSEAHRAAFERAAMLWGNLDPIVSELVFPDGIKPQARSIAPLKPTKHRLSTRLWGGFIGASVGVIALVSVLLVAGYMPNLSLFLGQVAEYKTDKGELRTVQLPDGSELKLNTRTQVVVDYDNKGRWINLDGEAYFKVAHNVDKPFTVKAGDYLVRAVGTAFRVYVRDDQSVEVTVTEGKVEISKLKPVQGAKVVAHDPAAAQTLGVLVRNQEALVSNELDALNIEQIDDQVMASKLAWRQGVLSFYQKPMDEVVREINRYSDVRVIIADNAINNIKVGGYFPAGETSAFLDTLESSFGIHVERIDNNLVVLTQ